MSCGSNWCYFKQLIKQVITRLNNRLIMVSFAKRDRTPVGEEPHPSVCESNLAAKKMKIIYFLSFIAIKMFTNICYSVVMSEI